MNRFLSVAKNRQKRTLQNCQLCWFSAFFANHQVFLSEDGECPTKASLTSTPEENRLKNQRRSRLKPAPTTVSQSVTGDPTLNAFVVLVGIFSEVLGVRLFGRPHQDRMAREGFRGGRFLSVLSQTC